MATRWWHGLMLFCVLWSAGVVQAAAQETRRMYAGALVGISTLSADGRATPRGSSASVSLYKPENGPALNAFVGADVQRFLSIQANYVANGNDLTLFFATASPSGGGFIEQMRTSSQHAFVADALLYFRSPESGVRPYLSTGLAVVRFNGSGPSRTTALELDASGDEIGATRLGLRVAVGIDLALTADWHFRYSFSETISGNPVSERLMPPGQRHLANFQNLFGIVRRF